MTQTKQGRSLQELHELLKLIALVGLDGKFTGDVKLEGADPVLRSPHHLSEATAYALIMESVAAACIWKQRKVDAQPASIAIDVQDAIHALHSTHFLWHSGYSLSVGAEYVPTNGIFPCKDGRFIMIEAGPPYTKLERGYLNFFDCGNNRESIARSIAKYDAFDLQEKLSELGLPACIAYTKDEWRDSEQGKKLLATPLVEIVKIADGSPVPFSAGATYPLDGVKVVDFTHVLAGPRSMRSLAQYGADVLHISSPYHRDTVSQNLLVNIGKRSAYLLLSNAEDQKRIQELVKQADVFSFSYRSSVAEKFGLTPTTLSAGHKGLVCLSVNAYGHDGPWKYRPGFDQNAQVATGFARTEGGDDKPRFSPVFYLNDFLTGYLAAVGVMSALLRRSIEGGSYQVKVSLARTAMWVQDLGLLDQGSYKDAPEKDDYPPQLHTMKTACGEVTELVPATRLEHLPRKDLKILQPFGADRPEF